MYKANMSVKETQKAIKFIKDSFQKKLGEKLNLLRVSAPMFVRSDSGLNDSLNDVERPVKFDALHFDGVGEIEIVHSLAKWKRKALRDYGFEVGEGLYTDMNAIRRDEDPDEIHSIYVDQWDFEKVIAEEERNYEYLKGEVRKIYSIFKELEKDLYDRYDFLNPILPNEITFIESEDLYRRYPNLDAKKRERECVKEYGAVFLKGIGAKLSSGAPHDGRSPDYDDWSLNGDILFYNPVLDDVIELSSLGIRVNKDVLLDQLRERGMEYKLKYPFHQALVAGKLPQSFGGGLGQSRICQFLLRKYHIGEVQCSLWPEFVRDEMEKIGVFLL